MNKMKLIWNLQAFNYISTQNGCSLATCLGLDKAGYRKPKYIRKFLKNTWRWWQAMAPYPVPLPCALALLPHNHRDATTPSPCWAPHFMTQERLSLLLRWWATTRSRLALTPPLHCASILQPATPPQVVAFESLTISAPIHLNRFTNTESRKPDLWTCVCVFTFPSSAFAFLIKMSFSFKSLFAIWSLSPQRFHY